MSETPRTDEYAGMSEDFRWLEVVSAEVARQLETELAEARDEIERLKAATIGASLLREKLAELAHNQWVGWMEYLFSKSKQVDGCVVIPAWANERWRRQVATRYADLSEEEKDSDRSEADKFLAVFNAQLAERDKLIEHMREIAEAVAGIAGKDWLWGQLALGEMLDGKPGPHCEWAIKSKVDYEAALAAERLKDDC